MIDYKGFNAYEKSIQKVGQAEAFMARDFKGDTILVASKDLGFHGYLREDGLVEARLNHENACHLREQFPFTAPSPVLRKDRSFGVGDRLGIAIFGHARLFEHYDAFPVFAQQSIRELHLTDRTYEDVLDAATFGVFREGFKRPWGADGDHLKTVEDVEYALSLGFTMITLDCSEHIKSGVTGGNAPEAPARYREKYLDKRFDIGEGETLVFDPVELNKCVAIYGEAITFAVDMWNRFFAEGRYSADFEISIDETSEPTTPLQHYFVARELLDGGVKFATLAPRFCGDFQKGIDYIGDLAQFEKEIRIHAIIARHFGYKLSIHSGSDKFSVFPSIGRETRGVFHVKTAGTNWLEALRVVAQKDPSLYRQIQKFALSSFDKARAYYHVTPDLSQIPDPDTLKDEELPGLFENNAVRQVLHITYGQILRAGTITADFLFKDRLYDLWNREEEAYDTALEKHIGKHLDLLGVGKI